MGTKLKENVGLCAFGNFFVVATSLFSMQHCSLAMVMYDYYNELSVIWEVAPGPWGVDSSLET